LTAWIPRGVGLRPRGRAAASLRRLRRRANDISIRLLDIVVSLLLLVVMLPAFVLLMFAVRLESPGGAFFRCRRVGRSGRDLQVLKFRKMREDAGDAPLTVFGDGRLTAVGRFLARWKLDELPQLWNVLRGQMSLVGPRPEDSRFVALAPAAFREILALRPGITGLSQIAFAGETSLLRGPDPVAYYVERLLPQKLQLDRLYLRRRSPWLNLTILYWTARVVLFGCSVAVDRRTGAFTVRHARPEPQTAVTAQPGIEQSAP
jgi:lipopolysaccharide/colanic/teichoic acid biosynthesis glycosyltransferase